MATSTTQPAMRADQLAPHSVEAEEAVLGAVLLNPECYADVETLEAGDFFIERHGWVWEAVRELKHKADAVTVAQHLEARGRLKEAGGVAGVLALQLRTPSSLNVQGYADIVRGLATRRRMLDMASALARMAHSEDQPIDRLMEQAEEQFKTLRDGAVVDEGAPSVTDFAWAEMARIDEWVRNPARIRGFRTGIAPLDAMSTGLQNGELTLLIARPGMGKSALLAQMASGLAQGGTATLLLSLEMTYERMLRRMACQIGRVSASALVEGRLEGEALGQYYEALGRLAKLPLYVVEPKQRTVAALRALARRYRREHGVQVVMVDTADKLTASQQRTKQYEVATLISGDLAEWAHEDRLALVVAKQVSRDLKERNDKTPQLTDIRDSGAYEQDADNVWALHRPGYYDRNVAQDEARIVPLKAREADSVAANKDVLLRWQPTWPGFEYVNTLTVELNSGRKERVA